MSDSMAENMSEYMADVFFARLDVRQSEINQVPGEMSDRLSDSMSDRMREYDYVRQNAIFHRPNTKATKISHVLCEIIQYVRWNQNTCQNMLDRMP